MLVQTQVLLVFVGECDAQCLTAQTRQGAGAASIEFVAVFVEGESAQGEGVVVFAAVLYVREAAFLGPFAQRKQPNQLV